MFCSFSKRSRLFVCSIEMGGVGEERLTCSKMSVTMVTLLRRMWSWWFPTETDVS